MLDNSWEKAHFAFGRYLDQLYTDAKQREVRLHGAHHMPAMRLAALSRTGHSRILTEALLQGTRC